MASFGLAPTGNIGVSGFTEALEADTKRRAEAKAKSGDDKKKVGAARCSVWCRLLETGLDQGVVGGRACVGR